MRRIPPKPLKDYPWYLRIVYTFQKKRYGSPLMPSLIWGRRPKLFRAFTKFYTILESKKSPLPPSLRSLVMLRVSEVNKCAFCIDMNAYLLKQRKNDPLSDAEKCALEYAEVITDSHKEVSDELFERLKGYFHEDAIVELTALIGYQNLSSKFNSALGIEAFGFCKKMPS